MRKYFIAFAVMTICSSVLSFASTPKTVRLQSQKDFEKGTPKDVSIDSYGRLFVAPEITAIGKSDMSFFWSGAADTHGKMFIAGGQPGKIFRINRTNQMDVYFELENLGIYAVAVDGRGTVYAASSPKGKVYKLTAANQSAEQTVFFDPEDLYIWSMAVDEQNNLFVATGGNTGNIYKITPSGEASLFYASDDTHIRKIVFDHKGNLIAGTSGNGIILRIDRSGNPFVLYDSPLTEITDVLVDKGGSIYAAAAGEVQQPRGETPAARPASNESRQDDEGADFTLQRLAVPLAGGRSAKNSLLYRIAADGTVYTYWTTEQDKIFALAQNDKNQILLGTGDKGRLYRLHPDGEKTLVNQFTEQQITVMATDNKGHVMLATSNSGHIYRLNGRYAKKGEYLSKVFDAKVVSHWGELSWEAEAGGELAFYSRSGNTEKPDKTWSGWSKKYTQAAGESLESPPARFIQIKAEMKSASGKSSPVVKEITFAYLQKNIEPVVKNIVIHPQGDYFPDFAEQAASNSSHDHAGRQSSYQNQSPGRKTFRKGFRSVSWKADDPNGDHLEFNLYCKGESEKDWKSLVKDFSGNNYSWDSELFPDGRYLLKIVTTDKPSNPLSHMLASEKISQPFLVDNSGPVISDLNVTGTGKNAVIAFTARDAHSNISNVEIGVNGGEWELVYPSDGICDSKEESFAVKNRSLIKGTNFMVVKATDILGNIGFGKKNIRHQ